MTTLKAWRTERDITQADFAKRIGATAASVSRIETGEQWPSAEIIASIERETEGKVTAADIFETYQAAKHEDAPDPPRNDSEAVA